MQIEEILKLLPKFKEKNFGKIFTVAEMEAVYQNEYVPNLKHKKIKLGLPNLDNSIGQVRPGQLLTIIAGTNVGKTAMLLNIARANVEGLKDKLILIFECELTSNEVYERLVQMEFDVHTHDVEEAYAKKNKNFKKFTETKWILPNIVSIVQRIAVEDIIPFCLACMELSGKEIGFIGIDYLGLLKTRSPMKEYDRVTHVMLMLHEIALHLNVPVINLSQPSRQDLKNLDGINLYSAKSSGEVENSSHIVIVLNRINETNFKKQKNLVLSDELKDSIKQEKVYLLKAKIEKKKQGKFASCYLLYDTKSTRISELTV